MNIRSTLKRLIPKSFHSRLSAFVTGEGIGARQQARFRNICLAQMRRNKYNYEPVNIGIRSFPGQRDWQTRWTAIKAELALLGPGNILDVGCAEGWFIRRAAEECGFFAIGIETRMDRIIPGEAARLHDAAENYGTIRAKLCAANILSLPRFDVISCFSVVHHIVYSEGLEKAREFINALGTRCARLFLFEMGTSDEKEMDWAERMPPMPSGQETFIHDFLSSAGFWNIRNIADSTSFKEGSRRLLFAASPLASAQERRVHKSL